MLPVILNRLRRLRLEIKEKFKWQVLVKRCAEIRSTDPSELVNTIDHSYQQVEMIFSAKVPIR